MVSRLYIPGLAEYDDCKRAFLRAEELLAQGQNAESGKELSDLLQILDTNADGVDFLKAEFGQRYAAISEKAKGRLRSRVSVTDNFIELGDIACVDADNNVFEHYDNLAIRKDIFRNPQGQPINFTPYNGVVHCEQNGLFLPSIALSCNIVAALYKNRNNADANALLLQYKDHGAGYGWQAQNTIINYTTEEVIHYPSAADFNKKVIVNAGRQRKKGHFAKATLQDSLLESALRDTAHTSYVKQLTGLADPAILVEIGKYFGKPAKLWFPWNGQAGTGFNEKRAAWFGCISDNLDLDGSNNLNSDDAARGVRRSAPQGAAREK
ncbi:MAG: hypothetical protein Q8R47_00590 [Nanoarchaeota archaeon]|nr:hypothetical protein [Nanoarchaeota archaeon]